MLEIQQLARSLEDLQIQKSQKRWTQYTTGFDFGVDEIQAKISAAYQAPESFQLICKTLDHDLTPADRRRVEILHRDFLPYHRSEKANALKSRIESLQNKLGGLLSKHRATVDGQELTSTELSRILSENPDRELRKRAHFARAQVNRKLVDGGFLDLLRLRKEYALACDAPDFISFSLKQDDLAPGLFEGWRQECASRRDSYVRILNSFARRYLGVEEYKPWDQSYLRAQICPRNRQTVDLTGYRATVAKVFQAYGFEIEKLPITYDIFPRKNKSEWGYLFAIQIGKDARVLANMDNRFSSYWTLLHETAHAVHFLNLDSDERLLNRGVSGIIAEGFANFFGDLSYSREFLSQFFGDEIETAQQEFACAKSFLDLGNIPSMATTLFDQDLYRRDLNSLQDITDLRWSNDRDLLGLEPSGDEPPWGYLIHHTTHPIYLHNYFLGDVMGESMKEAFLRKTGSSWQSRPAEFGRMWWNELLAPSGLYPFADLFQRATGETPNVSGFLQATLDRAEAALPTVK